MGSPEKAAGFFRQNDLGRVVDCIRARYEKNGGALGEVVIAEPNATELRGVATMRWGEIRPGPIRLRLRDVDAWLRDGGYECSLEEMLSAYYGEPPRNLKAARLASKAERREIRQQWKDLVREVSDSFSPESPARRWLDFGAHGRDWVLGRVVRLDPAEMAERRRILLGVARVVDQVPFREPRPLTVLANEVLANPHALDPKEEGGFLLTYALLDLLGEAGETPPGSVSWPSAPLRHALLDRACILVDLSSAIVSVFNLGKAMRNDGALDPVIAAVGPSELPVDLRRLLSWSGVSANGDRVYLIENRGVFDDIVSLLERAASNGATVPTVICTSGQVNRAVWRLLDLLAENTSCQFFYSGDFDLDGLRIADVIGRRYPDHFCLWRMDAATYLRARMEDGEEAEPERLGQLEALRDRFPELVELMGQSRLWAYQEAIEDLLFADMIGSFL